ncbi:MAG: NTP transferase domain-containing protein [candidate division Zixibacteria bacterium]|nr:NTP transferase domain-containing protein [candidate division Zixibacteria bacterium]
MAEKRAAVILAAGQGKRMKSDLPKVLHPIHGRPMIRILLDRFKDFGFDPIVLVVGHKGSVVRQELVDYPITFVNQFEQLGTAHAVQMAQPVMGDFKGTTLVAAGDVPFLSRESVKKLLEVHVKTKAAATCLSAIFEDPTGYGRIIRKAGTDRIRDIVEHKDASPEILEIQEINSGTFCFDNQLLFETIDQIGCDNAQGEYYLTDAVKILHSQGYPVSVVQAADPDEVRGVNSVEQLEYLAKKFELGS